jgi:hypothetical protein
MKVHSGNFGSGGKLKFDDLKYEVDDATCGDGQPYDLKFDADFG